MKRSRAPVLAVLLLPVAAWLGTAARPSPATLRIACFDLPGSFNPVYATNETAQAVANKAYQSLFQFDPQGVLRPDLVAACSLDEARNEVLLDLRPGQRFADGSPVESRDVAATIASLRDPRFEYPYAADLEFLERADALAPLRLRLTLKWRFAPWKNYLTFKVLRAAELAAVDPREFRRRVPTGSGPYRLAAVHDPQGFELVRNPHWPGRLRCDRLVYTVLSDPRQAPLKLLNAEVDAAEIHGDDAVAYTRLRRWQRSFRLLPYRKFGYTYLAFNLRRREIDLGLRQRVYGRLSKGRFLDDFLQDRGERVASPFLLLGAAKKNRHGQAAPPAAAGRRRLKVLTNSESALRRQFVIFLCQELKAETVELEPEFVEYRMFLQRLKDGDFDLAVSSFLIDIDWNMKDILSSSGYFNYSGYSDPGMDAALEQGLREMDETKRRAVYARAHAIWLRDLPLVPLFNLNYYMGVARGIAVPARRFELVGSCGDFFANIQEW
jgi:peptide/nickel transport system substrate-binding protein